MFIHLRRLITLLTISLATGCEPLPTDSGSEQQPTAEASTAPMLICATQPVPGGYVAVSASYLSTCPTFEENGYAANAITIHAISTLGSPATICTWVPTSRITGRVQQIPAGYVVVGASASAACAFYHKFYPQPSYETQLNAYVISTIGTLDLPATICTWVHTSGSTGNVQRVPAGYAVIGAGNKSGCAFPNPVQRPNAFVIDTLRSPMTICKWVQTSTVTGFLQWIPAGYFLVGESKSPACAFYNKTYGFGPPETQINAYTISAPTSPITICIRGPKATDVRKIPAGYVVVGATKSIDCPYHAPEDPSNAVTLRTISTLGSPATICTRWPTSSVTANVQKIPDGYVVVGASKSTGCAYHDVGDPLNAVTITTTSTLSSPATICIRWPTSSTTAKVQRIPARYVVVGVSHSADCAYHEPAGTRNTVTIRRLAPSMSICTRWPTSAVSANVQRIPDGYVVMSTSHSTDCAYYNPAGAPNTSNIQATGDDDDHDQGHSG